MSPLLTTNCSSGRKRLLVRDEDAAGLMIHSINIARLYSVFHMVTVTSLRLGFTFVSGVA